ncbi:hypothetical protein BDW02DRAFT_632809 [Decorospora gaudefroyi]|uniref:Uncharacterized protein n=1 Tax=Decorospora gaudefroyi TaxID=184978 RepID=A0A6A5KAJ3_9PLEO|nr:hypothetical protein BDW02DRAFT_632809 [Decorospora gaudefroyi]
MDNISSTMSGPKSPNSREPGSRSDYDRQRFLSPKDAAVDSSAQPEASSEEISVFDFLRETESLSTTTAGPPEFAQKLPYTYPRLCSFGTTNTISQASLLAADAPRPEPSAGPLHTTKEKEGAPLVVTDDPAALQSDDQDKSQLKQALTKENESQGKVRKTISSFFNFTKKGDNTGRP